MLRFVKLIIILLLVMPIVFAVGGGGGGGIPSCKNSDWNCSNWSECSVNSVSIRTCRFSNVNCRNPGNVKPLEVSGCDYISKIMPQLKCVNIDSMEERVKCRLMLTDDELREELTLAYLPEECRAMENNMDKEACLNLYINSQRCWQLPEGEQRVQCWKEVLNLSELSQEIASCNNITSKYLCFHNLKQKIYVLAKFRMYDLEERAEEALEEGKVDLNTAVSFITSVEKKKQEFNSAQTSQDRKNIILGVRELWRDFKIKIRGASDE